MDWDNQLDPIVITVEEVVSKTRPVLVVQHDQGHGGWQFYDGYDVSGRKPKVIPKDEMLALDDTLWELTDLPVGWQARRNTKDQTWVREPYTSA